MGGEEYFTGEPLRIGNETQLLIDDHVIEDRWRLTRVLHRPEKFLRNPILVRDKPWEGDGTSRPYVMWDDEYGRYRMWYQCFSMSNYFGAGGPPYHVCYAESDDGIEWTKPLLDVCEYGDFEKTNVVYCGTFRNRVQGVQVLKTPEDADPNRRYKMVCVESRPLDGAFQSGVSVAYSPDGLKWTLPEGPHLLDYHSDCYNHVVYDPDRRRWILYCRPIHMFATGRSSWDPPGGAPGTRHQKRRVAAMTSEDFERWSYPRTVMYPDERDTPDYDSCRVFRYGGQFLMFYSAMEGDDRATNEGRLASSRDGFHWERFYSRESYLGRGREGDWDAGQVVPGSPVRQGENLLIYYTGTNKPQYDSGGQGGVGLAMTKLDRFVEQRAGDEPGYLLTREFILEGNRLRLNTAMESMTYTKQGIRVAVVRRPPIGRHHDFEKDIEGFTLEDCDPLVCDRIDVQVTWKGSADLSALMGQPIYLRFEIQNMGLFSFQLDRE